MKVLSTGNKKILASGNSTLEILIAFAVLTLCMTAVIMIGFGNQSISVDTQTNNEALSQAEKILEDARANAHSNFISIISYATTSTSTIAFNQKLDVLDISECKKQATSTVSWSVDKRVQTISLATFLSSTSTVAALGGDCATELPEDSWNPPALFASDTISPGKFNTLDALNKIVYLGSDKKPYLFIADTRSAYFGQDFHNPLMISYANNFNSSGKVLDVINDIDSFKDTSTGKIYVAAATASTTAQLVIMDVTDINNPVIASSTGILAKRNLSGVTASDSTAWGWRVYYFDKKIYITSRETAGPELHIFCVAPDSHFPTCSSSSPGNPVEIGSKELNTTVNDFTVRNGIAYFAVQSDTRGELLLFDISSPSSISEIVGARNNLPGNEDGESVFLLGNKLFFGRQKSASGPELYIFDISNPMNATSGLPMIGPNDPNKEMNKDVTDIRVAGRFAFLASYGDSSGGFKVWDISNPSNIQPIYLTFNFGNKLIAIDYDSNYVYAGGESTPNFQMLYSP